MYIGARVFFYMMESQGVFLCTFEVVFSVLACMPLLGHTDACLRTPGAEVDVAVSK